MRRSLVTGLGVLVIGGMYMALAHSNGAENGASSSFKEVWDVVLTAPEVDAPGVTTDMANEILSYGTETRPGLPHFSGNLNAVWSIVSGAMEAAAKATVQSHVDYHDYFQKLVHANGTCFAGSWEITASTPYSGLFKTGAKALMIGRISAATPQTTSDGPRAFGFAGKLFATVDPNAAVPTANFFTVDNLNSTPAKHMLDVALTNEPPADLGGLVNPLKILNDIFAKADIHPTVRPLYPIAQAGLVAGDPVVTPKWMRIHAAPGVRRADVGDADFRTELSPANYPEGLIFTIDVSDTTKEGLVDSGWTPIGQIRTGAMVTSFGCDRRLHFHHMHADPARN